ncbi:MAG: CRISPR-associated protein Cas4 [Thermoplasmatales archaeon]|nr:MAG: CRISPR-associated protein Cas4 [Thermoplasmatales archaeon]
MIVLSKIGKRKTREMKKKYNIPEGKIAYSDLNKPAKPYFSKRYRITGKPDYILKNNKRFIPVEVKTGIHDKPQKNHIFQLAGYCHLLEENYGGFVPYGILVYGNRCQYKIPFDPKTRFELESTIIKMRRVIKTGRIERNHDDFFRCKSCSMNTYCDVKIA